MMGGDASPFDLPERAALDALASLARRVGASVALVPYVLTYTPPPHKPLVCGQPAQSLPLANASAHPS